MDIRSLEKISFETIFEAFSQAFADYEMQLDKEQLQAMLNRRGFNPELSFAVFDGDQIVAFTFNGTGSFNGILTAYDTGTGTLKDYQGKGLATHIFEHSIAYLRAQKIQQYLLEVLQHNTKAVSVYRKLGFQVTREFNYFRQKNEAVTTNDKIPEISCVVRPIDLKEHNSIPTFWDFSPSWQNSLESIQRTPHDFISLGAFV